MTRTTATARSHGSGGVWNGGAAAVDAASARTGDGFPAAGPDGDERWLDPGFLARLCADSGPDALAVIDENGVLRYVGGAVERLLGRVAADQIGTTMW
jgi:PAS domain-containing protein